ncbi:MAG TPA: TIGR03668 family PPOX class F420-dependent oxidoreductase [Roseiflexaceae bacterium]|nr:TIGR03668 family PPOX class F420-dependent oxidoreductase [Roseiflexaceae bacterium]
MVVLAPWELELVEAQRIARLATVDASGQPSVLPVVYAFDGERFVTPLDGKPKRAELMRLRRVRDIQANPRVALVIDRYTEDWAQLAWVQVRGTAALVTEGGIYEHGVALLAARYPQYAAVSLAGRPLIVVTLTEVRSWRADVLGRGATR